MQHSNLQRILAELGITPVYEYNGRTFYDTKDVFDRHNFARDVKRNVEEDDWVLEKTKYYLSERGIVSFAFKKGVTPVMERFLRVLESQAFPDFTAMSRPEANPMAAFAPMPQLDSAPASFPDAAYMNMNAFYSQNPYMMASMMPYGQAGAFQPMPSFTAPPLHQDGASASSGPIVPSNPTNMIYNDFTMTPNSSMLGQSPAHVLANFAPQPAQELTLPPSSAATPSPSSGSMTTSPSPLTSSQPSRVSQDYGVPSSEQLKAAAQDVGVFHVPLGLKPQSPARMGTLSWSNDFLALAAAADAVTAASSPNVLEYSLNGKEAEMEADEEAATMMDALASLSSAYFATATPSPMTMPIHI